MSYTNKAMYTGVPNIMDAFASINEEGLPFSVWSASPKEILFQYNGNDIDAGRDYLRSNLEAASQNGHNDLLVIKMHPIGKNIITSKTETVGCMYVRVNPLNNMVGTVSEDKPSYQTQGINYEQYKVMQRVESLLDQSLKNQNEIEARLTELEQSEQEDEPGTIGTIVGLLEHPAVNALIAKIFGGFAAPAQNSNLSMKVSGINDTDEPTEQQYEQPIDVQMLDDAVYRLSAHCEVDKDLKRLADLAEQKPDIFKMMLYQLRSL